jgi:hypothetical protein
MEEFFIKFSKKIAPDNNIYKIIETNDQIMS